MVQLNRHYAVRGPLGSRRTLIYGNGLVNFGEGIGKNYNAMVIDGAGFRDILKNLVNQGSRAYKKLEPYLKTAFEISKPYLKQGAKIALDTGTAYVAKELEKNKDGASKELLKTINKDANKKATNLIAGLGHDDDRLLEQALARGINLKKGRKSIANF